MFHVSFFLSTLGERIANVRGTLRRGRSQLKRAATTAVQQPAPAEPPTPALQATGPPRELPPEKVSRVRPTPSIPCPDHFPHWGKPNPSTQDVVSRGREKGSSHTQKSPPEITDFVVGGRGRGRGHRHERDTSKTAENEFAGSGEFGTAKQAARRS